MTLVRKYHGAVVGIYSRSSQFGLILLITDVVLSRVHS
jgi:hypothetical protein